MYIYIPSGKSLACFGGPANGTMGAGAGIELTSGNTLYLIGDGAVHVTGGNAANGDVEADYASEMRFAMKTGGEPNVIIGGNSSITFCVPVTVRSLTSFTVTGYKPDGSELFTFQKDISRSLELNKMYNMPTIHYPVEPQNK